MAYITQLRIGDNRTVFLEGGSKKCERELTMSFAFGELRTDDEAMIRGHLRQMGKLVQDELERALGMAVSEVRKPMSMSPAAEKNDEPAPAEKPVAKPTPPPAKKVDPPNQPTPATTPSTPPATKKQEPSNPEVSKPSAPESIPGEPAYDRNRPGWNRCPECGNTEINYEAEKENLKTGRRWMKKYQACFGDIEGRKQHAGIFLNFDGKVVEMTPTDRKEGPA